MLAKHVLDTLRAAVNTRSSSTTIVIDLFLKWVPKAQIYCRVIRFSLGHFKVPPLVPNLGSTLKVGVINQALSFPSVSVENVAGAVSGGVADRFGGCFQLRAFVRLSNYAECNTGENGGCSQDSERARHTQHCRGPDAWHST